MRTILLMLMLALCACSDPPQPVNPDPPVVPPANREATCADACAHMAELGCPEARPTPNGATCSEVCESLPLNVPCLASVTSCEQTSACWR